MKIIDGQGARLGRLASYAAKQALKGEKIVVLNCKKVIISGSKRNTKKKFEEKRSRVGHSQKGPKHHKTSEKIVKRAIRGMLPEHRFGRGKKAFERIRCYNSVPKEYQDSKKIKAGKDNPRKFAKVEEFE